MDDCNKRRSCLLGLRLVGVFNVLRRGGAEVEFWNRQSASSIDLEQLLDCSTLAAVHDTILFLAPCSGSVTMSGVC